MLSRRPLTVTNLEERSVPATLPAGFTESLLVAGLDRPSALVAAPDGRIFVAEQPGVVRIIDDGELTTFASVTVDPSVNSKFSHSGLIGITLDPGFRDNGYVYVYYTAPGVDGAAPFNRLSRFTADGNSAIGGETILAEFDPLANPTGEQGGTMVFGPDGKLYIGTGYAADDSTPQSLTSHFGKILRLNSDGSIPDDNPTTFDGIDGTTTGEYRSIWAVGLRQPYSISFSPVTGQMFIPDVGDGDFEEINLGKAGANYGWTATEGPFDAALYPDFTEPLYSYAHGEGLVEGNAITGGAIYQPSAAAINAFPASYVGSYFFLDFENGWINQLDPVTGKSTNFASEISGKLPDGLTVTPNGDLVYLSYGFGPNKGSLYTIKYTPSAGQIVLTGAAGGPIVQVGDVTSKSGIDTIQPFQPGFTGGVHVAVGDITGDRIDDYVIAAGAGGGPRVQVMDGVSKAVVYDFFAFESTFTGGVHVAVGDLNRDGFADLVVTPGVGGGTRVRIFSGKDGQLLTDFLGIPDPNFRGGATAAVGDGNGDGFLDLAIAAGPGGGPRVSVYDGKSGFPWKAAPTAPARDFFVFDSKFTGGVSIAAADVTGDGLADLIAGAGPGGGPIVSVFDGAALTSGDFKNATIATFFTGDINNRGGNNVIARNFNGDTIASILVGSGASANPKLSVYRIMDGVPAMQSEQSLTDPEFLAGVFVG